ncbi:M16 family metallopeptidase [Hufsiella ginkgonis]|uniref:Insulinase family protein n=1 Tax=Hufsiella ginkgonis TaxID=2695274 RepID=A0A7K1XVQ1_9SPHI|nr:pitrilysin family protein [Hufsiella ginkgonis]MXV14888.1 insulinase family protein [Hufsiella ginkgonis]
MKKLLLPLLSVLITPAFAQVAQPSKARLVEKVTKTGNELVVPYEKYVLPNGLTVILHEDHSDPVAHVDVTYHVGSAREEIGKSGFAHFFEHMMFQGSDNVADDEHFKIVTESGGTLNGSTNEDRTNYYETVPSNQVEKMIWLEADRMGYLLDAVTQKKFEIQRATVKNERGQNYDNQPYGLASEYSSKALYPYGHPYSWLTIGYIEDLNRVNVNDLKNFFLRWYGPNNSTITIGGDINPKQTLAWIEKYFGSVPSGPAVKNVKYPAPVLDKTRFVSYEDNYAQQPMLSITYPGVTAYDKDQAALNIMAQLIGRGNNSIFYKNFTKPRKASQASMSAYGSELAGEIGITVIPFPGQTMQDMYALVNQSLKEFEAKGVSDEDLVRLKGGAESQFVNSLSSVSGKVSQLAAAQTFTGNPNQIKERLKAIQSVTKEDVMRVYNTYVKDKNAVVLSVLPKGKGDMRVAPDNYTPDKSNYKAPDYGYDGLKYVKGADKFDRKATPATGTNPVVASVPKYWTAKKANGIKIIGSENTEIPSVSISVSVDGGGLFEEASKAGLAGIVGRMLNEDTKNFTSEAFSAELQKIGSNVSAGGGSDGFSFQASTLTKNLDRTLALLEERMFNPKFTQESLDRIKQQTITSLRRAKTQPAFIASNVYNKLLYGNDNLRVIAGSGTEKTIPNITLADVQAFYDTYVVPSLSQVVVIGDIKETDIKPKLAFLDKWKGGAALSVPKPAGGKTFNKTTLYFVDVSKAAQSEIRIGNLTGMNYDASGEYYRAGLMNYNLGAAFSSRINLNLREDKGWTYGARSTFTSGKYGGTFTASAGVRASATDSSVVEFMKEISNYAKTGITPAELTFMKSSIGQSTARSYETNAQKAGFLSRILEYDLAPTYVDEQSKIRNSISKAEIDALAKKYLDVNKMIILVVGDKDLVMPGLKKLGYDIVELDADGNPKG